MNKFSFTKQANTSKTNVWYDSILIGELDIIIKESPNIDWAKYRADKSLRLDSKERWVYSWKASTTSNITTLGVFNNKESAAQAILDKHRKKFKKESTDATK
jgi:hypothetical protein